MRRFFALAAVCLATNAWAVAPQFWTVDTPDEFLSGELEGMAITSRGELKPAPGVEKIASFTDPFVLSQTSDPSGTRYFGTGNDGNVYKLSDGKLTLLYSADEPEIYALAFDRGALLVGSSPNGKVYRVDPKNGKATVLYDPQQAYIWSLAVTDGGLLVATGIEGKIFRVDASGKGSVWFDAPETHIRSLAIAEGGRVLAGGAGSGRIYEIDAKGQGRSLFESSLSEISAIHYDAKTRRAWAAAVVSVLPTSGPSKQPSKKTTGSTDQSSSSSSDSKDSEGSASVDISFSFDQTGTASRPVGSSEIYSIEPGGYVEIVQKFDREIVYSITDAPDGGVYVSTGPLGRIYHLKDHELSLAASVPQKQVVSFSSGSGTVYATTTNDGAVYRIEPSASSHSEFRSDVKDTGRFSEFGQFILEGTGLQGAAVAVSFRSGNTSSPDETWSGWSEPVRGRQGQAAAPSARYVQWKLDIDRPQKDTAVQSMTLSYVNRNVAPTIESLSVDEPGVVYIAGSYPAPPQVVEATNPDEYGIFTSLDSPAERTNPGKKYFRKGYRTISWKARDANGDSLRADLQFRRVGDAKWLRLRGGLTDDQLNFDTSQLPDGRYEVRLTVTDELDNPGHALTDTREAVLFTVDNSAPAVDWSTKGGDVEIRAVDALSPIAKAEYSLDAEKWIRLESIDGIVDSSHETFRLGRQALAGHFVVVRVVDRSFNVATVSIPGTSQ